MMDLGEMIVEGERPIHWKVSYSAEPLFMYVLALAMPVWGFTPFGARLVTRFAGLLLIPVVHRLTRRLFGRCAALFTSGVLALTWWPLFFSRVALRGITLPLIFTTAVICLWRGLDLGEHITRGAEMTISWGWLAGGGALMGLTWYTFTAARGLAILLPVLLVYLGLVGAVPLRLLARIAFLTLGVASVVAAPFVFEVQTQPGVPETRLDQLGGVIDQLLAGNLLPLVKQSVKTVGLFTVTGDPSWRYNVAGRPVFGPVLGVLAMLGVLLSIARWRQPRYFVMIMWLLLGLAPSMLTPEAPSLVRGIGALPAAVIFPAIGAATVQQWVSATVGRKTNWAAALAMTLLLAVNGVGTFRSLFVTWPAQSQVREIYQAALTKAFRDLNHSNLGGTLWISEPFPDDRHLLLAKRVLRREAIEPRWFNANRALILPAANGSRRYLLADFVEPDQELFRRWMSDAIVILEARVSTSTMPAYRTYQARGGPWVERELSEIMNQSTASRDLGAAHPVALPARFEGTATLLGYELADDRLAAGEEVHLAVYWRVHGPVFEPLVSFAHLLDGQNRIIGQYDGFDVPPWHWEPGAVVAQVYRFSVDRDAQPGTHWVEVGLYNSETMERLAVVDEADSPLAPRLVLGTVIVE
jgi:4-amino-4-deoxy-L-arabinose transferase-like glycosyltransferase